MKPIRFHHAVLKELKYLSSDLREELASALSILSKGVNLGMPLSRPMPDVENGVHELRIKDKTGQFRIFYFTKSKEAILVFHLFKKKTQTTPKHELLLAKKRLSEMKP